MARNLDVILDLATLAWKSGASADTIIRLLQDVELGAIVTGGVDEPATAEPEAEQDERAAGAGIPAWPETSAPDYRGEAGHSDSGLTGPPGTMLFGGTDKPAKPE